MGKLPRATHSLAIPLTERTGSPRPLRLGAGEYAGRGDWLSGPTPAGFGRIVFVGVVGQECPPVFEDLIEQSTTALATYRPLLRRMQQDFDRRFGKRIAALSRQTSIPERQRRGQALLRSTDSWFDRFLDGPGRGFALTWGTAMRGWMTRWNLGDAEHPELATIAFGMAGMGWRHWEAGTTPSDGEMAATFWSLALPLRDLGTVPTPAPPPRSVRPRVTPPPPWDRIGETKAAYLERARASFDQMIESEVAVLEARGLAEGYERTPVKTSGDEHFRWLARYQVGRERLSDIARSLSDGGARQPSTVREAIEETARLIDLPLREPDPRGRPRLARTPVIIRVDPPAA